MFETKVNQYHTATRSRSWIGLLGRHLLDVISWQNSRLQLVLQMLNTIIRIGNSCPHSSMLADNLG